ncbi:unnamed protein product [Cyclocybe aegerita]|uniref:Uncharacterized protein n=1 Tax=Cyclocybe aegerita TaxID=1973307 RepID=A0A8S0W835_CYCAE|nr:unnamed protein product [Cyclocybe aegerita]
MPNNNDATNEIERTERDETSGNKLRIYLRPSAKRNKVMRFQLFWKPIEHQVHHYLCTTTVSPPPQHDQGKRYCFMRRNSNTVYSTGTSKKNAYMVALPSCGSYVATATLKFKQLKDNITPEVVSKLETLNKDYLASLPDLGGDTVLVEEEPSKIFQFTFHSYEPKARAPTRTAKRKRDEFEDSDSDVNSRLSPEISILATNYKQSRVSDSHSQPRPSGSSSQGSIHVKRRLTSPSIMSAPARLKKNTRKLEGIMEETGIRERTQEKGQGNK